MERVILHSDLNNFMVLCESVSSRMREYGFVCNTVQLGVRDNELCSYERQGKLSSPNRTAKALLQKSFELYKRNHTSGKSCLTVRISPFISHALDESSCIISISAPTLISSSGEQ